MERILSKCKNCGSELFYDIKSQVLSCQYCETQYHLPKTRKDAVLVRGYSNSFHPNQLNQTLNCFECKMCNHTYFSSSDEHSKKCPNCGSTSQEKTNSAGYCADGIIPFEISKDHALKNLKSFLKSKPNIPKTIRSQASLDSLTAVYIPVWNFVFDIDLKYTATASDLRRNSNGVYYSVPMPVYGEKRISVKSADQCASSSEYDEFLELFDEKDYDKIIPYTPEYTYGCQVDNINRDIHEFYEFVSEEEINKAKKQIFDYTYNKFKDLRDMNISTRVHDEYFNFCYVPVYVYNFKHKDKTYKIYVSGTSGKVAGNMPKSFKSVFKTLAKFLGLAAAIAFLSYFIFN